MNLVIVESSTKAKIIEKYLNESRKLNDKFKVIASQGHIRDLAKKNMGIDPKTFDCKFEVIPDKKKIVNALSSSIKSAKCVYLAADHDREGEGIAWHIQQMHPRASFKRILFNEITKPALENAVLNATTVNLPMVHSYLSRRILDRLVGFMITKLLWKSFDSNITLTAGRVQSATLNIIVDKEKDIKSFESTPYWTIKGVFGKDISDTTLYYKDTIFKSPNNKDVTKILKTLVTTAFTMKDVKLKALSEKAPSPFTTSTLQQTSYSSLHLPIKMTMSLAQDLYEMGAITYMRTDSTSINPIFRESATDYVQKTHGDSYVQQKLREKKASKNAQEAHEAIRPTSISKVYDFKTPKHEQLYRLIWNRTIAYFMADAVHHEVRVLIEMDNFTKDYAFVGKEKLLYFNGWLKLYGKQNSQIDSNSVVSKYAKIKPKPSKFEGHNVWTNPPARYNESSIIDKLEKSGVGRPSTYASIMNKLFEKQYIEKRDIVGTEKEHIDYTIEASAWSLKSKKTNKMVGDENKRLIPTDIGKVVDAFVADNFKNIVDIEFTSSMEDSLDKIANQTLDYKTFLKAFYKNFHVDFTTLQSKLNLGEKSKGQIGKEEELLYSEKEYMVVKRTTRYGPVIEKRFLKEDEKSEYINLERYLQDTDKTLEQITKEDANLMLRLPLDIMHNQNTPYQLRYGRYGFYLINMKDKTTLSIFKPYVKYVLDLNIKELFENTVNKSKANTKKKNKN